ncbi:MULTISPECIES: hypothetical protein [Geobacillus]|jgi:hypothetical protein|nr:MULTISPECIES: hypothetical protein [Geobacillus]MED3718126.1 hypothetical protein [Geobacillus thermodenitrificans]
MDGREDKDCLLVANQYHVQTNTLEKQNEGQIGMLVVIRQVHINVSKLPPHGMCNK